jgi:hypothetical protein
MSTAAGELQRLARLLRDRERISDQIAGIIGRPALPGHIGEWIAAQVFGIDLERAANRRAFDGRFRDGALAAKSVNVKLYGRREGILDTTADPDLDFYLVLTGRAGAAGSSQGATRPLVIAAVYLFDAHALLADFAQRGRGPGVASSVRNALWDAAEIYPSANNPVLRCTDAQRAALALFARAETIRKDTSPDGA